MAEDLERRRIRLRAWKKANRAKINEAQRRRRAANPEQTREYGRQDYERHREARLAKNADWCNCNPERKRELRRQSAARHAATNRARVKAWQEANPEKVKAQKARDRAKRRRAPVVEHFTRLEIAERDNWCCHICAELVTQADWSLDHLIPLSRGGEHSRANVALAHQRCNSARGNREVCCVPA